VGIRSDRKIRFSSSVIRDLKNDRFVITKLKTEHFGSVSVISITTKIKAVNPQIGFPFAKIFLTDKNFKSRVFTTA